MTLKEEAIDLINKLPDKVMGDIVTLLKKKDEDPITWETPEEEQARKAREREESMKAFLELEEMIKAHPWQIPENYEDVYADAMAEKYGRATA